MPNYNLEWKKIIIKLLNNLTKASKHSPGNDAIATCNKKIDEWVSIDVDNNSTYQIFYFTIY